MRRALALPNSLQLWNTRAESAARREITADSPWLEAVPAAYQSRLPLGIAARAPESAVLNRMRMMSDGFRQRETTARQPGRLLEASLHAPASFALVQSPMNSNRVRKLRQIAIPRAVSQLLTHSAAPVIPSLPISIVRQELPAAATRKPVFPCIVSLGLFLM